MPLPSQPPTRRPEPQDPDLVVLDLTWERLDEALSSRAVDRNHRLTIRHLLAGARREAPRWSQAELCIEIVTILAIALGPPAQAGGARFDYSDDDCLEKGSTMT